MTIRRLAATFLLLVNSAALVLAILTLANGEPLADLAVDSATEASGLLVIADRDAALTILLAAMGLIGNLVLGYVFLSQSPTSARRERSGTPTITGE